MPAEDKVEAIFHEQLEKCGVEYFDYYLLHNLNRYLYPAEVNACHLFDYMKKWKEQGKIRHIAFSYHDDAEHLDKILTEHPEVDAVQIVLNYYDWEELFIQSKKCYEVIVGHGKKVIVMEPVLSGMSSLSQVEENTGFIGGLFRRDGEDRRRVRCKRRPQRSRQNAV